jgi:putative membrane protein
MPVIPAVVVIASLAARPPRPLYRPYHDHHLWWFVLVLLLLALLIVAVGALLVAGRPRSRSEIEQPLFPPPSPPSAAEQILAERLARGEIDGDEYRRRRDALRD